MKYGETEITMDEQAIHVSAPRIEVEIGENVIKRMDAYREGLRKNSRRGGK